MRISFFFSNQLYRANHGYAFILLFSGVLLIGCGPSVGSKFALIGSSSMEPTLTGPRLVGCCRNCQTDASFSSELVERLSHVHCPACDQWMDLQDLSVSQPGQSVAVQSLNAVESISRGDLIVFSDLSTYQGQSRSIKRLVGFPGESIRIDEGDLFVNGMRYQKSASDFWSSAIHVDSWESAIAEFNNSSTSPIECYFDSMSLWPRVGESVKRHSSPILDELSSNPDEPYHYTAVKDIGVILDFDLETSTCSEISIGVWCKGFVRTVVCQIEGDRLQIRGGGRPANSSITTVDFSRFAPVSDTRGFAVNRLRLMTACVDDRIIASVVDARGREISSGEWPMYDCLGPDLSSGKIHCSIERPIYLRVKDQVPAFRSIEVVRDIHYRGPQGEATFALPTINGYHVLGDNVSMASDSRNAISDGISRRQISGRVDSRSLSSRRFTE